MKYKMFVKGKKSLQIKILVWNGLRLNEWSPVTNYVNYGTIWNLCGKKTFSERDLAYSGRNDYPEITSLYFTWKALLKRNYLENG